MEFDAPKNSPVGILARVPQMESEEKEVCISTVVLDGTPLKSEDQGPISYIGKFVVGAKNANSSSCEPSVARDLFFYNMALEEKPNPSKKVRALASLSQTSMINSSYGFTGVLEMEGCPYKNTLCSMILVKKCEFKHIYRSFLRTLAPIVHRYIHARIG